MSEFFLELFSEEIPSGLQKSLREKILDDFKNLFDKNLIKSKKSFSLSSPNRVVIVFKDLDKLISTKNQKRLEDLKPKLPSKQSKVLLDLIK